MEANLLDRMLETYLAEQKNVVVTLQNKVRITGRVSAFDSYVLVIDGARREFVYRHAVASVSLQDTPDAKQAAPHKPAPSEQRPKTRPHDKPRPPQSRPEHAAPKEPGINSGMKDGLLKWMQQKATK